ncbi:RidA family protein [Roseibium porphyridii]|uniref:RidA family protein n=1 Tax=Roseibium porphyridii TaxID=2866279 RepID=A0ABY8F7L7_9HYPH|nr:MULTISPECIES: RidA family protein [Stappiaceae]QFT30875.1 RutC family protein YjgH [Labrenzia sp. THAF82]WFE91495.1 RidA family protein [Roseibium sp. KMA01]
MTQTIKRMNPPSLPDATAIGYSQISIVETGKLAFVSGQVALPADGSPVPENLREQAAIVAENAGAALQALGAEATDIAMARCYVTDLTPERLDEVFPPILDFFNGAKPSLTGIGVAALAAPEFQVELELTVSLQNKN